ncbi:L,D-transpeptidase [Aureimonas glaciei]|uniref:L,D-transpeptidase n=1 Tax=Aureimonas glaciei TaxID=1776957 RepID=A0A917DCN0_9HYPH|nr:L,D-transpeptidase [Aureimonas glaciei]GGD27046.1 L,D-transpeptidase [Aureimonas glaciei]
MNDQTPARGLTRRHILMGLGLLATTAMAGCTGAGSRARILEGRVGSGTGSVDPSYLSMYGPIEDGGYLIPGIDFKLVDPMFFRQEVANMTGEAPGTMVIDTANRFAYFTQPDGRAMRYGVGIGRDGFSWSGRAVVRYKRKWPTWTPPSEMIARQPELEVYRTGMEPGLKNPLGARALYLFQNGEDTLYRLHGTPEYWTIGKAVSSGCVRFMNHDIIDLYNRVPDGTPVVVIQSGMV